MESLVYSAIHRSMECWRYATQIRYREMYPRLSSDARWSLLSTVRYTDQWNVGDTPLRSDIEKCTQDHRLDTRWSLLLQCDKPITGMLEIYHSDQI
ncbi:hypothetical protein RRG08_021057 [Elysia crispata]|uniref:Uncharacterized protein n=1 Tax=Elysia crispata TaxID=231223 RepID=A0AAE0Z1A4_9GAST|nr:hypothetical protein RRG08_021057 [Elysia crispata]